jgi:hypothetical protein
MLVFVLILSAVVYCVLYWLWAIAQSQPQNMMDVIHVINGMLFVPGNTIFLIFRGVLLLTIFYVIADFFVSGIRHGLKMRRGEEEPHELQLKYIHPRR